MVGIETNLRDIFSTSGTEQANLLDYIFLARGVFCSRIFFSYSGGRENFILVEVTFLWVYIFQETFLGNISGGGGKNINLLPFEKNFTNYFYIYVPQNIYTR